jgi:hypothetical protein
MILIVVFIGYKPTTLWEYDGVEKKTRIQDGAPGRSIAFFVGAFITPISLGFLLVIYRTSFHGIINPPITWGAPPCGMLTLSKNLGIIWNSQGDI